MGKYVHYTQEEKERANRVNLEELLLRSGEELLPSGREKRLGSNHSITICGNCWYDHAEEKGGLAIDFVKMYYGKTFSEAMAFLLSEEGVLPAVAVDTLTEQKEKKPLEVPPKSRDMKRLYAYLIKKRKLDVKIVNHFVRIGLLYESSEQSKKTGKFYHNAIFVGKDAAGTIQHIHKKGLYSGGKNFKGNQEGNNPAYSFQYRGKSDKVYVFEAPVDLLSYLSMYPQKWQQHSYIALMGVGGKALMQFLEERPDVTTVVFALDNDPAGQKAIARLAGQVTNLPRDYQIQVEQSILKDWNEDLQAISEPEQNVEVRMAM